jgi:hypothetical protein
MARDCSAEFQSGSASSNTPTNFVDREGVGAAIDERETYMGAPTVSSLTGTLKMKRGDSSVLEVDGSDLSAGQRVVIFSDDSDKANKAWIGSISANEGKYFCSVTAYSKNPDTAEIDPPVGTDDVTVTVGGSTSTGVPVDNPA